MPRAGSGGLAVRRSGKGRERQRGSETATAARTAARARTSRFITSRALPKVATSSRSQICERFAVPATVGGTGRHGQGRRHTRSQFGRNTQRLRAAGGLNGLNRPSALPLIVAAPLPPQPGRDRGRIPPRARFALRARAAGAVNYSDSLRLAEPSIVSGPRPEAEIWIRRGFACSATGNSSVSTPWS
jgi:hypothetical protein